MENEKKLDCFVISPIGPRGSETRNRADLLFNNIIRTALDENEWNIIRADQITGSKPITSDMINRIHQSELCIIDLTGTNPNVMYEFGMRYETGKPFILLAKEEEELPFDVKDIRTIKYNLDDVNSAIACIRSIKDFLAAARKDGFPTKDSEDSLSSISARLSRIENAIRSLPAGLPASDPNLGPDISDDLDSSMTPNERFRYALQTYNIPAAERLLPYFERTKSKDVFYDQYLEVLAREGSKIALTRLLDDIDYVNDLSEERKVEAVSLICIGLQKIDMQEAGLKIVGPVIDRCIESCDKNSSKATLLNQKARLVTDNKKRIEILSDVIKLNPNDPSFNYNLSVCYEKEEDLVKAKEYIDICMANQRSDNESEYDSDHVGQAIDVYAKLNDKEKVNEYLRIIQQINPKLYVLKQRDANRYLRKAKN